MADLTECNLGYNILSVDVDFCRTHKRSTRTHDYTNYHEDLLQHQKNKRLKKIPLVLHYDSQDMILSLVWLSLWRLMPLSTIFQLYCNVTVSFIG